MWSRDNLGPLRKTYCNGFGSPPQIENFYLHLKVLIRCIYNAYTLCEHSKESCKLITNITNMREMTKKK